MTKKTIYFEHISYSNIFLMCKSKQKIQNNNNKMPAFRHMMLSHRSSSSRLELEPSFVFLFIISQYSGSIDCGLDSVQGSSALGRHWSAEGQCSDPFPCVYWEM